MNKAELVAAVAEKAGLSSCEAGKAVNAVVEAISCALAHHEEVAIAGFGTFKVSEHAARVAHNPRTGEAVKVPACHVPAFHAGKALKEAVNK